MSQQDAERWASPISRRRLLAGGSVLGGAVLLGGLAGCGGNDDPTSGSTTAGTGGTPGTAAGGTATSTRAATGSDGPRPGGSLRVATADGLGPDLFIGTSFGPQLFAYVQMAWPLFLGAQKGFDLVNGLADSYEASPDGLSHTVKIRSGLTFHDGSPLDAEAVAENFRSSFFEDHPLRDAGAYQQVSAPFGTPAPIASVDVLDDTTVTIVLTVPKADIRDAVSQMVIMNPRVIAATDSYGTDAGALRDAGSGPFRVVNFSPASFIEYERFDGFFEPALLDRLRVEVIADPAAMALALQGGQIDAALGLAKADHDVFAADDRYNLFVADPATNVFFQFLTPKSVELEDVRVRRAIAMAMNRQAYNDSFFNTGTATLSTQPVIVPGARGYNPDIELIPYDPEGARALMAEAGVESVEIGVLDPSAFGPVTEMGPLLEAIAADLEAIGVSMTFSLTDFATFVAEQNNYDANVTAYGNGLDPFIVFNLQYQGPAGRSLPDPRGNLEIQQLLQEAAASLDPAVQEEKLRQIIQIAHDEVIGVPISVVANSGVAVKEVQDFNLTLFGYDPLHKTWIAS